MKTISVIDSHTGGEPTRIVVGDGPDLGAGSLAERAEVFRSNFDHIRTAVIAEPRGSDVLVGGILCEPSDSRHAAGIIFFDNAGLLGMCGHGSIGLAVTLHHMGKIAVGSHTFETPVGNVEVELLSASTASITNVPSYRFASDVGVEIDGYGSVTGDIAWGGNWFFLTGDRPCELRPENTDALLSFTKAVRTALGDAGITGPGGEAVNHVEIHGPPSVERASAKNFVLCPGGAYDRSPCGTGTSAKLACLAADGKLKPGEVWKQESIIGSIFETSYRQDGDRIVPKLTGSAHICGESTMILDPSDPFCFGIGT